MRSALCFAARMTVHGIASCKGEISSVNFVLGYCAVFFGITLAVVLFCAHLIVFKPSQES